MKLLPCVSGVQVPSCDDKSAPTMKFVVYAGSAAEMAEAALLKSLA